MAAAQHGLSSNMVETDNSIMVKKVETTPHEKQPQVSVRASMIENLNVEMEIKLSSLSVCCSSFQSLAAANWKEERPGDVCCFFLPNHMTFVLEVFRTRF